MKIKPWIGFLHVQPEPGSDPFGEGRKGAFTHALALARNADDYSELVRTSLLEYNLIAIEIRDLAPLSEYRRDNRITYEIGNLAEDLSMSRRVIFDVFDTYLHHDS